MTTNQTIDGVLGLLSLLERLRIPDGVYIEYAHGAGQDFEDALRELRALLDKEVTGDSRAPQTQGEPVTIDDNVEFEKWWMSTPTLRKQKIQIAQEAWFARAKLAEHPAPVAPTPINYGALDPVERLAVCRGEVAPGADAWPRLEKPAKVGPGRFQVGVSSRLVVEAAQRHYEYEVTPGKEAIRIAQAKDLLALLSAPVAVVLPDQKTVSALVTKAARQADLTNGANYFTAAEFAAEAVIDELKRLNPSL